MRLQCSFEKSLFLPDSCDFFILGAGLGYSPTKKEACENCREAIAIAKMESINLKQCCACCLYDQRKGNFFQFAMIHFISSYSHYDAKLVSPSSCLLWLKHECYRK